MVKFLSGVVLVAGMLGGTAGAQEPRQPFSPDDLVRLNRLSDPQVSPDGRYVVYTLRETEHGG